MHVVVWGGGEGNIHQLFTGVIIVIWSHDYWDAGDIILYTLDHTLHIPSFLFLQELNLKAEAKFNKLKNQAKGKITALSRELEQLKGGKGDTHLNTSQVRWPGLKWLQHLAPIHCTRKWFFLVNGMV